MTEQRKASAGLLVKGSLNKKLLFLALVLAALLVFQGTRLLHADSKRKILEALEQSDAVQISQTLADDWSKIYFLGAYDLTMPLRLEIFGEEARDKAESVPWADDQRYWSIIITKFGASPEIIRLNNNEYAQARNSLIMTSEKSAQLTKVPDTEKDYDKKCADSRFKRTCLRLERGSH